MVVQWTKQGNHFYFAISDAIPEYKATVTVPNHPRLSAQDALQFCIHDRGRTLQFFPAGILISSGSMEVVGKVDTGGWKLSPGLYEYRGIRGDNRLPENCRLSTNKYCHAGVAAMVVGRTDWRS